jgi:hypothetical protein
VGPKDLRARNLRSKMQCPYSIRHAPRPSSMTIRNSDTAINHSTCYLHLVSLQSPPVLRVFLRASASPRRRYPSPCQFFGASTVRNIALTFSASAADV